MPLAAYVMGVLIAGAALAYPAYLLTGSFLDLSIERVTTRCLLLAAFALLPLFLRWTGAADRTSLGFGTRPTSLAIAAGAGLGLGIVSFLPIALAVTAAGARVPAAPWLSLAGTALGYLPHAILTGLAVALVEECLFRGALLGSLCQTMRARAAILLSSLVFAAVHFVRPPAALAENAVGWTSGFAVVAEGLGQFLTPGMILDDFLALLAGGGVLAWLRCRSGHIGWCIGVHAGWVTVIKLTRKATSPDPESRWAFLVGDFDGVIGYAACTWMVTLSLLYYVGRVRRRPRFAP